MKKMIMVGIMAAFFCTSLLAQDLPMLRSTDALRTYALEESARVTASINASLPVGNNSYGFVPVESPTAEGINNTIRHINLSMDVANPNDYLYTWSGVYSSDGDPLFTGSKRFKLENAKGGYALPVDYGDVTLVLYDEIPIRIANAQSAQLTIQNSKGETEFGTSLRVSNGKVYFPRQLAGTNAVLSVSVLVPAKGDGSVEQWLYWSVRTGSSIKPEHFTVNLKTTIQGVLSITDDNVMVPVPTRNGIGTNITAELKITANRSTLLSFWTTEGKWFKGTWVRKAGTSQWQYYPAVVFKEVGVMGVLLNMEIGIYYSIPDWNDGDLVEPSDPWYPSYYGGKY